MTRSLLVLALLAVSLYGADENGELLYNGIRLPPVWPPRAVDLSKELATPQYLLSPPAVIPIDVGRQLFVDDFLISNITEEVILCHIEKFLLVFSCGYVVINNFRCLF